MKKFALACISAFSITTANATTTQDIIQQHFLQYQSQEYYSAVSVSIAMPGKPIENYAFGTLSHNKKSAPVSPNSLFEIGSITKSFTAALILKLEEAKKLKLTDTVSQFFPDYKKWGKVSLTQLLNMTSGIPNYSDTPEFNYLLGKNVQRIWSIPELIFMGYPPKNFEPPLKTGYYYTNTGYLIAGLIAEKVMGADLQEQFQNQIFKPLGLKNTFYPVPNFDPKEDARLVHGYGYNQYENPELVGKDLYHNNLTWAGAAGGIVATTQDVALWVRGLFTDKTFLSPDSRTELTSLVSVNRGEPLKTVSKQNRKGFGLGVVQMYNPEIGPFWFYEARTLGFRTIYLYVPCNQIIIVASFNSATNVENDHAPELMMRLYKHILAKHPGYQCTMMEATEEEAQ